MKKIYFTSNRNEDEHLLETGAKKSTSKTVKFVESRNKKAKYVIVKSKDPIKFDQALLELDIWRKPSLVLSILGSRDNFPLSVRLKNEFKKGLIEITESIDTLIITEGIFSGISKVAGEAIEEKYSKNYLITLGIPAFENLMFRENLKTQTSVRYRHSVQSETNPSRNHSILGTTNEVDESLACKNDQEEIISNWLEPNHSHFILVETNNDENNLINFHVDSYKNLATHSKMLLIVMNGDYYTLKLVHRAALENMSILVIARSGGIADLIVKAIKSKEALKKIFLFPNKSLLPEIFTNEYKTGKTKLYLEDIFIRANLFKILYLNNNDQDKNYSSMKTTVFDTVFSIKKEKGIDLNQLKSYLEWDLSEKAKDYILSNEAFNQNDLYEIFNLALEKNNCEFVKMVLDIRINIGFFLTNNRLYSLYNSAKLNKKLPFKFLSKSGLDDKNFYQLIYISIRELDINYFDRDYLPNDLVNIPDDKKDSPIFENDEYIYEKSVFNLFLWALLTNKFQIAKIFLKISQKPISSGLFACILLKEISRKMPDSEEFTVEKANEFEELSIEILKYFDDIEPDEIVEYLLLSKINKFQDLHLLDLAEKGKLRKFMSTEAVKRYLKDLWNNGHYSYNTVSIKPLSYSMTWLVSLTFGVLAPLLIFEPREIDTDVEKLFSNRPKLSLSPKNIIRKNEPKEKVSYPGKWICFFSRPATRFFYDNLMFLCFLVLFSYYLLCQFDFYEYNLNRRLFNQNTYTDYILTGWVFCFMIEELKEAFSFKEKSFMLRLKKYISDNWNILDFSGCIIYLIGFGTRLYSLKDHDSYIFEWSRIILCIDLIIWYFRILHFSLKFPEMGPKLVMIHKMLKDLIIFFPIFLIFLLSYGITIHATLYPKTSLSYELFEKIIDLAYWPLFGEITFFNILEKQNENQNIVFNSSLNTNENPRFEYVEKVIFGYLATILYMIVGCVLLMNIIIAVFSSTYSNIQNRSNEIWNFQHYKIVYEYDDKVLWHLPPPFNIIGYIFNFCYYFWHCRRAPISNEQFINEEIDYLEARNCKLFFRQKESNEK